jgi:hypothetical protein
MRDLAANFVRAIDRTALDYEGVATAELADRTACLVALHEMEGTEAELAKTPTADLRQRLNLIRQVVRASQDLDWEVRRFTNGELKKRIEYVRLFTAAETDFGNLSDERLNQIDRNVRNILRDREREAKAEAKAQARVAKLYRPPVPTVVYDEADDPVIGGDVEAA